MKNSADQGGCYPQRPKAEVDNTFPDLQNSSYPTKAQIIAALMLSYQNCNSAVMETKLLCVLVAVVVSLNVEVS